MTGCSAIRSANSRNVIWLRRCFFLMAPPEAQKSCRSHVTGVNCDLPTSSTAAHPDHGSQHHDYRTEPDNSPARTRMVARLLSSTRNGDEHMRNFLVPSVLALALAGGTVAAMAD